MSEALAVRDVAHDMPLDKLGNVMASSWFFKDSRSAAQAIVKIIAGREMGIGAVTAMTGIHIIEGKVAIGAGLLAAAIKRSGRYNYRVVTLTDTEASVEILEGGKPCGISTFTAKDAAAAKIDGKTVWKQYPKNMLFARAISNAVRFYCPDVTGGPMYTPEELGAEVNSDGEAINVQVVEPVREAVVPAPRLNPAPNLPSPTKTAPAPVTRPVAASDAESSGEIGIVEDVSSKSGEKNGKPWTRYEVKINGKYYNTFDTTDGENSREWVGQEVRFASKFVKSKNPAYKDSYDLTMIQRTAVDNVTYEDGAEQGFMFGTEPVT